MRLIISAVIVVLALAYVVLRIADYVHSLRFPEERTIKRYQRLCRSFRRDDE
jgi:hypothetical protein